MSVLLYPDESLKSDLLLFGMSRRLALAHLVIWHGMTKRRTLHFTSLCFLCETEYWLAVPTSPL